MRQYEIFNHKCDLTRTYFIAAQQLSFCLLYKCATYCHVSKQKHYVRFWLQVIKG